MQLSLQLASADMLRTDQKTLFSLPGLPASQTAQAKAAISRLPPLIEKRRAAETAEMMGKLKELGNSFLGALRLSRQYPLTLAHR